jgi:hypothetical protein
MHPMAISICKRAVAQIMPKLIPLLPMRRHVKWLCVFARDESGQTNMFPDQANVI